MSQNKIAIRTTTRQSVPTLKRPRDMLGSSSRIFVPLDQRRLVVLIAGMKNAASGIRKLFSGLLST
jgi:hypothetical protein